MSYNMSKACSMSGEDASIYQTVLQSISMHSENMKEEMEKVVCSGLYSCGQVVITEQSSIDYLNSQGMGSMRIYHAGSFLTRARSGGKKPNATDLSFTGLGEENEDVFIAPSIKQKNNQNVVTASYDLFLTEEESIYLFQLGELNVIDDETQQYLSIEDLFERFSIQRGKRAFLIQYAVYSFFKKRKFVVKSGINFGMDYCIYRDSPERVHAEMCVRVVDALNAPQIVSNAASDVSSSSVNEKDDTAHLSNKSSRTCHLPYRNYDATYSLKTPGIHPDSFRRASHSRLESDRVDQESYYYYDNLPWKALSTITRVMPDVMKLGLLCYVLPSAWQPVEENKEEETSVKCSVPAPVRYAHLFDTRSSTNTSSFVGVNSWPKTLDDMEQLWTVRPVSIMVRRLPVSNIKYPKVEILQQRYRAGAKINIANQASTADGEKKKSKRKNFKKKPKSSVTNSEVTAEEPSTTDVEGREQDSKGSMISEEVVENMDVDVNNANDEIDNNNSVQVDNQENLEESDEDDNVEEMVGLKRSHKDMDVQEQQCPDDKSTPPVESAVESNTQLNPSGLVLPQTTGEDNIVTAFKKARVRRDIDEIRGKSALTKKATIWELLSSTSDKN